MTVRGTETTTLADEHHSTYGAFCLECAEFVDKDENDLCTQCGEETVPTIGWDSLRTLEREARRTLDLLHDLEKTDVERDAALERVRELERSMASILTVMGPEQGEDGEWSIAMDPTGVVMVEIALRGKTALPDDDRWRGVVDEARALLPKETDHGE